MQTKDPHERRAHAMRVAGVVTAFVFVGWVTTLGVRLGSGSEVAQESDFSSQAASAIQATYLQQAGLEVASTSYTGH